MKRRTLSLAAVIAGVAIAASSTWADPPNTAEPRRQPELEGESRSSIDDIPRAIREVFRFFRRAAIFSDGNSQVSYRTTIPSSDLGTHHDMVVSVETRLFRLCYNRPYTYEDENRRDSEGRCRFRRYYEDERWRDGAEEDHMWIPVEISIRAPLEATRQVSLERLRVAALRGVIGQTGFTYQFAGYSLRNLGYALGTQHSAEFGSLTYTHYFQSNRDGSFELMVRGHLLMNVWTGTYTTNSAFEPRHGSDRLIDGVFGGEASAAIGLRFARAFMVDFFGGARTSGFSLDTHETGEVVVATDGHEDHPTEHYGRGLHELFAGLGARVEIANWVHLRADVQRRRQLLPNRSIPGETQRRDDWIGTGTLELRW